MDAADGSLRRDAFARLASLSTNDSNTKDNHGFEKLVQHLPPTQTQPSGYIDGMLRAIAPASRLPMNIRELDVLLALCATAPRLRDAKYAERLALQLGNYLPEAHAQLLIPSPFLQEIKPSPWAVLTQQLTNALLGLGLNFPALQSIVKEKVALYISNWASASSTLADAITSEDDMESNEGEALEIAAVAVSMVGFMEAAARHENIWDPSERLQLTKSVKNALSERFLIALEKATSIIRHSAWSDSVSRDWKKSLKHYAAQGAPLGAMLLQQGFMHLVLACTSRLLCSEEAEDKGNLLEQYAAGTRLGRQSGTPIDDEMIDYFVEVITEQMNVLEDGSDYLQLSSAWQQRLAFSVKAITLEAFAHCMIIDEDIADAEVLLGWIEDSIDSQPQMANAELATVVMRSLSVVARYIPEGTSNFARTLLRFIVQGNSQELAVDVAASSLAHILRILSQDAIITTLYSLGNVLSSQTGAEKQHQSGLPVPETNGHHNSLSSTNKIRTASVISLTWSGDEETSLVCGNVAKAIVEVATTCNDYKITALVQTMMIQKIGRINVIVDAHIIEQSARLAVHGKENELRVLLRLYSRLHQEALRTGNTIVFKAVQRARQHLAVHVNKKSPMFRILAMHLLERILTKGDVVEGEFKHSAEVEQAAQEIAPLLKPLATLASRQPRSLAEPLSSTDDVTEVETLAREAWFNIAVHGITLQSRLGQQYYEELRLLAMHSQPLVDLDRAELLESDVELNTVLRRGMSPQHTADQKRNLTNIIPGREHEIRHMSYQKVVFLNAVYLMESLRATSGSCSEILEYFADHTLLKSNMGMCLSAVADTVVKNFVTRVRPAKDDDYSAPYVARQLAKILSACCHRSAKMQEVARNAANEIITFAPSALCQKSSLFALLELLTLMWSSCLEAELDEYGWKSTFTSIRGKVTVELSDDYAFRKRTLDLLYQDARRWTVSVIAIAPLDVKGLLQTYLSEFDDTGSYGHVSLGRSFAVDMGALIPPLDPRLGAIERERHTANVNVASDFVAQYTTRQEYRFGGVPHDAHSPTDAFALQHYSSMPTARSTGLQGITIEAQSMLAALEMRTQHHERVSISELKDVLRRAAALLCRSKVAQTAIVRYLVQIPFEIFSKDSIKMGISLWLGVIHENPRMESRILQEVAQAWERTIDRHVGILSPRFRQIDPFYAKMLFAPTDREDLHKQSQSAQSTISPHLRVLQFFESHFNAIRLGSVNTQRTIVRMVHKTLDGFVQIKGHPLLREIHFHVVLFALRVLQYSTCLNKLTMWKLKDKIIATGLRWFASPPYWSFGSSRLQVKAEVKLMQEVLSMLAASRHIGHASIGGQKREPQNKQDLLEVLLQSEIARLQVFLQPVSLQGITGVHDAQIANFARSAWSEDPALAIQLVTRFPSAQLHRDVRFLLCNFPDKALHEPNAVDLLLGDILPTDLSFQLKYLILWDAVNPMQAVTYFMPAFGNHPFILQYAMRALESHSVDITFFYVPQIVQCLRYDALEYVERYIVETGKISQLFAHQIIWNMKANAYKDDDSTIPDPAKPVLDKVMNRLISSFSGEDKDFYEREFAFFGEVTDISGKLKPFIKKSKPEKKAKIEEELRKIKVEVGVYLPSNPDGVVVGIDRKSGKPLQSHAKAPYMATFRIRKQRNADNEEVSEMVEEAPKHQIRPKGHTKNSSSELSTTGPLNDPNTYEVWQSAIFKVGDDCRQDVLALQMIAAFRGIFNSVGLDVYVFPYRVTATAPGCGVIDVLPNSISRDMLGREAVNGLYDYFVTKYGGEHSVRFQEARSEFVKSMAAYSVISYLLQFKDRHNGNIMVDDKGHILHIDFGFCFDIAPGGVKFERAPFKLTPEMLAVMGGNDPNTSQAYRWFEELTVKAFLVSRQYCDKLCHLVTLMLDSGLPCFKPETIKNFRSRFVLEKTEKEAAEYMLHCTKKSAANFTTKVYDEFQLITNGIPY